MRKASRLPLYLVAMIGVAIVCPQISQAKDASPSVAELPTIKKQKALLSPFSIHDRFMMMWVSGPVSRALRLHPTLIPRLETATTHQELTPNGIKSVLQNLKDMGVMDDLMAGKITLIPTIDTQDIQLTEREEIEGIMTWTFDVPVEIEFRDQPLTEQPESKKQYRFLVRAIRTDDPQYVRGMALEHIEEIKEEEME